MLLIRERIRKIEIEYYATEKVKNARPVGRLEYEN